MLRILSLAAIAVLLGACGNLEDDRLCLGRVCAVKGRASPECLAYVSCWERTGGTPGALDSTYGEGGGCWTSGIPAVVASCTSACQTGLSSLEQAVPDAGC